MHHRESLAVATLRLSCASLLLGLAGCSTATSGHAPLGPPVRPLASEAEVVVMRHGEPPERCARVARLDVHLEKTMLAGSSLEDALPALKREARAAGANTIAEIEERTGRIAETRTYHVTALGLSCEAAASP
jgi:hypothetical protein